MQALLLNGSSKNGDFSQQLSDIFVDELKKHDNKVEVINLCDTEINSCRGALWLLGSLAGRFKQKNMEFIKT